MAGKYDINLVQGEDYNVSITLVDNANTNLLIGATSAVAQIKNNVSDANTIGAFVCAFTSNNAALNITMNAANTLTIKQLPMVWDCKVIWPNSTRYILSGKVILTPTASR